VRTQPSIDSGIGFYDRKFSALVAGGRPVVEGAVLVAHDYLDGKPMKKGSKRVTNRSRNTDFWSSRFLGSLPPEAWLQEPLVFSLARYMSQESVSNTTILRDVARASPESVCRAVRYSGLVLRPQSLRRRELDDLASSIGGSLLELTCVLDAFDRAHRARLDALNEARSRLSSLSPLETLSYASLYAFDRLVPRATGMQSSDQSDAIDASAAWDAINDLLIWKLSESSERDLRLTEALIEKSFSEHLTPFLFASDGGARPRFDLLSAFYEAMLAQVELNAFLAQSVDAFSFDDSIRFVLEDGGLGIVECDAGLRSAWKRDSEKLARVRCYWFYRGMEEFARSEYAGAPIGRPENHDANRIAVISAMSSRLRLVEVYGVDHELTDQSGDSVALFTCLLSLELMSAFFTLNFLMPYTEYLKECGNSLQALGKLAWQGLTQEQENRFPLTWSEREAKVTKLIGWTVTATAPTGSAKVAGAVLDFWSSDWVELAERLRKRKAGLHPHLFERPVLKLGRYLVQLPWMVATQDNQIGAINNLRRLGARRREALQEARRVELKLAQLLESRGFRVISNWMPPELGLPNAGEIDLICARDGLVVVVEVKSTFFRRTLRDAWLHAATTLRSAGVQLQRKVAYVTRALAQGVDMLDQLGFDAGATPEAIHGWIVDTSIEQDHRRFSGFLKVSLEEVMIALRDDRVLLNDPIGAFDGRWSAPSYNEQRGQDARWTLYPEGFSARRFVEVVESMLVWEVPPLAVQTVS
jgi:hypothetical protein